MSNRKDNTLIFKKLVNLHYNPIEWLNDHLTLSFLSSILYLNLFY